VICPSRFHRALLGVILTLVLPTAFAAEAEFQVAEDVVYGDPASREQQLQSMDIYYQSPQAKNPVVIYVHGGGWAFGEKSDVHNKPAFFALHKMAFISMNYRLRWDYDLYDQLEDVIAVINWVKENHARYGLDPERVILMGHGSGAHLVSLVGTNEDLLKTADLKLSDISAVVAIDTSSFDIPMLMKESTDFLEKRLHRMIFGDSMRRWSFASPISYVEEGKQYPRFALLYVAEDEGSSASQAKAFSRALSGVGGQVIMIPGNQKTAETIDEALGSPGDTPTLALMAFIRAAM
jgi:acetyl esterase/lipase